LNESSAGSAETVSPKTVKRRRIGPDTVNDLIFWGMQLALVAISLAIVWSRLNATNRAIENLFRAQGEELVLVRQQTEAAQKSANIQMIQAEEARQAEHTRSIQFGAAMNTLQSVLKHSAEIQAAVDDTLAKATQTNDLVLAASQQTKVAAQQAASAAGGAAGAAYRAAAVSQRTGAVVATKVVTTNARDQLNAQKAALARKQAQLARTIKQVKKNGPTIFQRLFNQ